MDGSVGTARGWTVREIVVTFDKLPEVPVMVTVTVPVVADPLEMSVNVLVLVAMPGLKDGVTPLGRPDADRLTLPLKPFCGVTLIVLVPLAPCTIVTLLGDAESVKFATGAAFTVREICQRPCSPGLARIEPSYRRNQVSERYSA